MIGKIEKIEKIEEIEEIEKIREFGDIYFFLIRLIKDKWGKQKIS